MNLKEKKLAGLNKNVLVQCYFCLFCYFVGLVLMHVSVGKECIEPFRSIHF